MLDFLPPDAMTLSEAGDTLTAHLPLAEHGARETDRTFYDTFDGLLHAKGLSCEHERGRLTLVEIATGQGLASLPTTLPTQPLPAAELPARGVP